MIINVNSIKKVETEINEDIVFSKETYVCSYPAKEIKSCHAKAVVSKFNDFTEVVVYVDAVVRVVSSYTLNEFDYKMHTSEEYHFGTVREDENSDITLYKGNEIKLDEYIFMLICASLPMALVAPGEKLPKGGNGVRVLTEKELAEEQENEVDPRFSKLDELDID